jgi:hypothetical protein
MRLRHLIPSLLVGVLIAGCSQTPPSPPSIVGGDGAIVEVTRLLTSQVSNQRISPLAAARVYGYSLWGGWSAHEQGLADDSAAWVAAEIGKELIVNRNARAEFSAFQLRRPLLDGDTELAAALVGATLRRALVDGESSGPQGWGRVDGDYAWRPTGTGSPGLDPTWGEIVPIVENTRDCQLPSPDIDRVLREAETMRGEFDPEGANSDITLWWLAGNATPTPSGQWLHIIANYIVDNQIGSATAWKLLGNAGVAAFDVSIAIWREKYRHNLLRPESLWFDQVGDAAPMLRRETPNHPSYPSGHSGFSSAAAAVLTGTLGVETVAVRDNLPPDVIVPAQRRDWANVWAAVDEAGLSRVLSGFHYPVDVEAGNTLGRCVAAAVIDALRPVPTPTGDAR